MTVQNRKYANTKVDGENRVDSIVQTPSRSLRTNTHVEKFQFQKLHRTKRLRVIVVEIITHVRYHFFFFSSYIRQLCILHADASQSRYLRNYFFSLCTESVS